MTKVNDSTKIGKIKEIITRDPHFLTELIKPVLQELLEGEMAEFLGAEPGERTEARRGYRAGYYSRNWITRMGNIELRVPRDRDGKFSTELFERYQRSEKALFATLAQMYVSGVSTRKVGRIAEQLCGQHFSASTISTITKGLDEALTKFADRPLTDPFPYVILDARYEKVRVDHVIKSQAVLVAIGIGWDGRRQVLGVEMDSRESYTSWSEFLIRLKRRGLSGVEFVVSDDHPGLKKAIREVFLEASWQRCYVHFLRNAMGHLPRKGGDDCLQELRWIYDRREAAEARRDLATWLAKWQKRYPKLTDWVEENIEDTWTFYKLPFDHHKHLKSTNMLERVNEELKRRTHIVRVFPNVDSCLRLSRAVCVEIHENWLEDNRYINMESLKEHKKEITRQLSAA